MNKKKIVFLGKTGSGKSSLINSLFDTNFLTDNAVSCTKQIQSVNFKNAEIFDTPGIAEELVADNKYFTLYRKIIGKNSTIIWVFQADTRVYKTDQLALKRLKEENVEFGKLYVALNQVDLIGNGIWNNKENEPSDFQKQLIEEKIQDVVEKFQKMVRIKKDDIIPVSAKFNFNTDNLKSLIYE